MKLQCSNISVGLIVLRLIAVSSWCEHLKLGKLLHLDCIFIDLSTCGCMATYKIRQHPQKNTPLSK